VASITAPTIMLAMPLAMVGLSDRLVAEDDQQ
jgi:hypothetical protein